MEESEDVKQAMVRFYEGLSSGDVEHFDDIVSAHPATLVIGTAPGEWVREREKLRFGFEAEGARIESGSALTGYAEGTLGWVVDDPIFHFGLEAGVACRLTAVFHQEEGGWKLVHMHVSAGVPDEEVVELQARWSCEG